jgi:uncharacterized membrane protein YtjA (UPF0391 family)
VEYQGQQQVRAALLDAIGTSTAAAAVATVIVIRAILMIVSLVFERLRRPCS